jgi:hypothetical protein
MTLEEVDATPDTLTDLVRYLCTVSIDRAERAELHVIDRGAREAREPSSVRTALMELPIDSHTFRSTYQRERRDQITCLRTLRDQDLASSHGMRSKARGFVGLLLATLCGLEVSEVQRQHRLDSETTDAERARVDGHVETIRALFADDDVRAALVDAYFGDRGPWWPDKLELRTLRFWRAGTTSAIMSVKASKTDDPDTGRPKRYALKVVWLPFLRIAEIARATESYASLYTVPEKLSDSTALVPVHDSGSGWVIMDFVEGRTLDEHLTDHRWQVARQSRAPWRTRLWSRFVEPEDTERVSTLAAGGIDLTTMQDVALGLCKALAHNQRVAEAVGSSRPRYHGDLTPANIIVRNGHLDDLVLIDFGVNHLFTRTASVGDEAKASFIAPEARKDRPVPRSDLFSLGQILIDAAAQRLDGRGIVPDRFYDSYPGVAELLEDLLDADPACRMPESGSVSRSELDGSVDYLALQAMLQFELDVAVRMGEPGSRRASSLGAVLWELRAPFNGEPLRQVRAYGAIYSWPQKGSAERFLAYTSGTGSTSEDPEPGAISPVERAERLEGVRRRVQDHVEARRDSVLYLRGWSLAGAFASFVALFFSFWWLYRAIPFGALPGSLAWLRELADAPSYLPHVDQLAVAPVPPLPRRDTLAIRLGAFSYALLHAKLYQAVYARMRPVAAAGVQGSVAAARAAGFWMRLLPFLGAVLVLWVTLRDVQDWVWAIVIGQTATFVGNVAIYRYVRGALDTGAQRLNTVPQPYEQIAGYDSVRSWVRGSLFEAGVCWSVGLLLAVHALQDVWLYASMIAALNIFLLYLVKCGLDAPEIRVALHRASFSARRLTARAAAGASSDVRRARSSRA